MPRGFTDVGVNDWNIQEFHGYSTPYGTSYNAFLIVDEKIALVDTVKVEFVDRLLENISQIVPPQKIDYVISNHTEMDHSGGLPRIMQAVDPHTPYLLFQAGAEKPGAPLHGPLGPTRPSQTAKGSAWAAAP